MFPPKNLLHILSKFHRGYTTKFKRVPVNGQAQMWWLGDSSVTKLFPKDENTNSRKVIYQISLTSTP